MLQRIRHLHKLSGVIYISNLTATTNDVTTGISTLYVYSNNPGYYSCEVTTEEGNVVTHTVRMLDTTLYTGKIIYIESNHKSVIV